MHFQSSGTSPFAMLCVKISLNGDAIAGATSLSIVEFKVSTPGALYGFRCVSFFSTTSRVKLTCYNASSMVF